jgi:rhodanese-related sulfurtransferase
MTITRLSIPDAVAKLQAGYLYVDVRTPAEFAEGHPPLSINVPYAYEGPDGMVPNADFVHECAAKVTPATKFILGCRSGGRSMKAGALLEAAGYTDLFELRAGWDGARDPFGQLTEPGWSRCGLPIEP